MSTLPVSGARPFFARSDGGNSPITCCSIIPTWKQSPFGPSSGGCAGATTRPGLRPGNAAGPAIRWLTQACVSFGPLAGCTIASAWSRPSFLTKHLLVDWRAGAAWFLDTLVDADRANNSAGWQWVAGSGADAMPYNRIFNPVAQSERFDRGGCYLRHWLPELRRLPDRFLHAPWTAPRSVLNTAGIDLGKTIPLPIVDHSNARQRALAAWRCLRGSDSDRTESADGEGDPERKK